MKTTNAIQDKRNSIVIVVKQERNFLKPLVSGSGRHRDRRLGRMRTRASVNRRALSE